MKWGESGPSLGPDFGEARARIFAGPRRRNRRRGEARRRWAPGAPPPWRPRRRRWRSTARAAPGAAPGESGAPRARWRGNCGATQGRNSGRRRACCPWSSCRGPRRGRRPPLSGHTHWRLAPNPAEVTRESGQSWSDFGRCHTPNSVQVNPNVVSKPTADLVSDHDSPKPAELGRVFHLSRIPKLHNWVGASASQSLNWERSE